MSRTWPISVFLAAALCVGLPGWVDVDGRPLTQATSLLSSEHGDGGVMSSSSSMLPNMVGNISYPRTPPGRGCRMRHPTEYDLERVERLKHTHHADNLLQRSSRITVPMHFHVLLGDGGRGDVSESEVEHQMQVLNKAFSNSKTANGVDTGVRFGPVSVSKYVNPTWNQLCSTHDREIASQLTKEVEVAVNVFVCSGEGLLGWATGFPWDWDESSREQAIFISSNTMAQNGPLFPSYDKGVTLVHEMGHYLGLFHTFHGGCSSPGDSISDTPAQRYPTYGTCEDNQGKDTCNSAGSDDVSNFMDYSDDACMDHFSPEQVQRMHEILTMYRPRMVSQAKQGPSYSPPPPPSYSPPPPPSYSPPPPPPISASPTPAPATSNQGSGTSEFSSAFWYDFFSWFWYVVGGLLSRVSSRE